MHKEKEQDSTNGEVDVKVDTKILALAQNDMHVRIYIYMTTLKKLKLGSIYRTMSTNG